MRRFVALYVVTLILAALVALAVQAFALRPVVAQGSGDVYIYGHVEPRAGFVLVTITQPGGVVVEKLTDSRGEWGASVRWRAGTYRLECDDAVAAYAFGIAQGETESGPWIFTLWGSETPTVTATPSPLPSLPMPTDLATYQPTPRTPTPTEWDVAPTATATPLPQPDITPLVLHMITEDGDYVGELNMDVWVGEDGVPTLINFSGAVWRE